MTVDVRPQWDRWASEFARQTTVVADRIARFRFIVCAGAAAALGLTITDQSADMGAFAVWGSDLVHGRLAAVYAGPGDQAGPLQLLANWLLAGPGSAAGPGRAVAVAADAALVVLAMVLCRRAPGIGTSVDRAGALARRELLVGVAAVVWLCQGGGLWSGHPAEIAVPVLWMCGLAAARRDRWWLAGLSFGSAATVAPWALLAVPAVVAVTTVRRAVAVAAGAVAVSVAAYLPFGLTGQFALFAHVWRVSPGSLVALLDPVATVFGWPLRLGQAALVAGATAAVAAAARRRPDVPLYYVLLAPAVLRVLTDPVTLPYYWMSYGVLAVVGLAGVSLRSGILASRPSSVLLAVLPCVALSFGSSLVVAVTATVILGTVLCGARRTAGLTGRRNIVG